MNIAVVLAGGTGQRMGSTIPKQFINVLGRPVITYTLEVLENNANIDAISVVTVQSFADEVAAYKEDYGISKLRWVVAGGATCQESIKNGVFHLADKASPNDTVSLIMSVTPLISDEVIDDSIRVCKKFGNAVAGSYPIYNFSTIKRDNPQTQTSTAQTSITDTAPTEGQNPVWADNIIKKEEHIDLNMPWTFPLHKLLWAYRKAYAEGLEVSDSSYTTNLMIALGEKLYFSKDTQRNKLKLTTFDDVDMLEGYLLLHELRKGNSAAAKQIRKNAKDV